MKFNYGAIKALRDTLGLTQQQFADKIGASCQSVSQWESETQPQRPSSAMQGKIMEAFGAKPEFFWREAADEA